MKTIENIQRAKTRMAGLRPGTAKYLLITLCFCAFVFIPLRSQTQNPWQWVKQLGGDGTDLVGGMANDSKNNLYVAGGFFNTLRTPDGKVRSAGDMDIFIAQFDEKGKVQNLWSGGGKGTDYASCITVNATDMIIVGGTVSDTISIEKFKNSFPGKRLFISALNAKGKFQWMSTIVVNGNATLTAVSTDKAGNIYALGSYLGELTSGTNTIKSAGKSDIFLASFQSSGIPIKLVTIGSEEEDLPGALAISDSGNVVISGQSGKTFQLGSFTIRGDINKPRGNAFIVRFASSLEPLWVEEYKAEEYCNLRSLAFDKRNNLYVGGSFSFSLQAADTVFRSNGYSDILVVKYDAAGRKLWGRSLGTWYYDHLFQIVPDKINGAIVTGLLGDTLRIDSLEIRPATQENSALILQFDSTGRVSWGDCISGNGRNFSTAALLDNKGNLYMAGSFRKSFEKEGEEINSYGEQDIFLAKYFNCLTNKAEILGSPWLCPGTSGVLKVKIGYKQVTWNDSIHRNYLEIVKPGTYRVSMYDKRGCLLTDSIHVSLIPRPGLNIGNDTCLWVCDSVMLKAQQGFTDYSWNNRPGNLTSLATSKDKKAGTYPFWVTVTDSLGCVWTDSINITFLSLPERVDLDKAQLTVYPNPATDMVFWSLKVDAPCKLVVELTDEHGRTFFVESISTYMPGELRKISLENIPMGPYHLRIKSPGNPQLKTTRIIKR